MNLWRRLLMLFGRDRLANDLDGCFGDLVRAHQDLVFGVALRIVKDAASAEDVAQEAFVRAYKALKRYDTQRIKELRPRPWLQRIFRRLFPSRHVGQRQP